MNEIVYKALIQAGMDGEARGFMMAKIAILHWLLDDNRKNGLKSVCEIAENILSIGIETYYSDSNSESKKGEDYETNEKPL